MEKDYKEVNFVGGTIERAVNSLQRYQKEGQLVSTNFNGTILYSDTVTMDRAYKAITGKTKDESDKAQQQWREEYDLKEKEHQDSIPILAEEWKKRGREILTENRWEYWDKVVPIRLGDLYHGIELGCCLDIVEILNSNGTLNKAKEKIKSQNHSGMSYNLVCLMVREFCDKGQEFTDYVKL